MVKSTTKKSTKKATKNNSALEPIALDPKIVIGVPVLLLIAFLVVLAVILHATANNKQQTASEETFVYTGTIDCQPPLSENEAALCKEAENAGYKNIVY